MLNWGEYINQDVVDAFEEEYGVRVRISASPARTNSWNNASKPAPRRTTSSSPPIT
ncbi:MAG: hypothetical protein MZU97_00685 [Bacillus subtilis]|nr:hypothetical protein [Bacillus subtilis]